MTSRIVVAVLAVLAFGSVLATPALAGEQENGVDRPGGDYSSFDIPAETVSAPASLCQSECDRDSKCEAWTVVAAGVQGSRPKCWLKSAAGRPRPCRYCISGISGFLEDGIDRPGSDYKIFDLARPNPTACLSACSDDKQCVAWTYVNPGVQGPRSRCYLKTSVPRAFVNGCCTSGLPAPASGR